MRLNHVAGWIVNADHSIIHGRGVWPGTKGGNGVAVGEGVPLAEGFGVAICACAAAKKATKPTRTHTLRKAIPERDAINLANVFIHGIQSHCAVRCKACRDR